MKRHTKEVNKWLLLTLLVMIVVAGILLFIFKQSVPRNAANDLSVTSSPSPITGWLKISISIPTPVESNLAELPSSLSLQYPPSLKPVYVTSFNHQIFTLNPVNPQHPYSSGDFEMSVTAYDPKGLSLKSFVDTIFAPNSLTCKSTQINITPITVADTSGLRVASSGCSSYGRDVYFVYKDRIIAVTSGYSSSAIQENNTEVFDTVVNSLKII